MKNCEAKTTEVCINLIRNAKRINNNESNNDCMLKMIKINEWMKKHNIWNKTLSRKRNEFKSETSNRSRNFVFYSIFNFSKNDCSQETYPLIDTWNQTNRNQTMMPMMKYKQTFTNTWNDFSEYFHEMSLCQGIVFFYLMLVGKRVSRE